MVMNTKTDMKGGPRKGRAITGQATNLSLWSGGKSVTECKAMFYGRPHRNQFGLKKSLLSRAYYFNLHDALKISIQVYIFYNQLFRYTRVVAEELRAMCHVHA